MKMFLTRLQYHATVDTKQKKPIVSSHYGGWHVRVKQCCLIRLCGRLREQQTVNVRPLSIEYKGHSLTDHNISSTQSISKAIVYDSLVC